MNNIKTIASVLSLVVIFTGTYLHSEINKSTDSLALCVPTVSPTVTAKAYYVENVATGDVLFEKNSNSQLPLASLTKIMTALVASNSLKKSEVVSIPEKALEPEGDSGLFASELWEVGDLTDFTLMTSSNDGAHALALLSDKSPDDFISEMNVVAKNAGLSQTFYLSDTGLDISTTTAGAYGSARDMANLMKYALNSNLDTLSGSSQKANVYTSVSGFIHKAEHTSSVAGSIPGELIVKTGFTDLAGGNLAVLAEIIPGTPVAIVVLGSELEERDNDILALVDSARQQIKKNSLCSQIYGN